MIKSYIIASVAADPNLFCFAMDRALGLSGIFIFRMDRLTEVQSNASGNSADCVGNLTITRLRPLELTVSNAPHRH